MAVGGKVMGILGEKITQLHLLGCPPLSSSPPPPPATTTPGDRHYSSLRSEPNKQGSSHDVPWSWSTWVSCI